MLVTGSVDGFIEVRARLCGRPLPTVACVLCALCGGNTGQGMMVTPTHTHTHPVDGFIELRARLCGRPLPTVACVRLVAATQVRGR